MTDHYALLVQQAQSDNPVQKHAAFNELVAQFQRAAFYQAYRILNDSQMAQDVTQEAFLTAYQHIHQVQDPAAFPGWLRRIVLTQCDRQTRRKLPPTETLDDELTLPDDDGNIEFELEVRDIQASVQMALAQLPEHERAVTEGFYLQGESQQELADRLQIPLTTVKKRLQYAREHLRLIVSDLNAAMDGVVAGFIPAKKPEMQKEPIYIYARRRPDLEE
jgi:RNA polymerase sigma factor (sigma-70 family)